MPSERVTDEEQRAFEALKDELVRGFSAPESAYVLLTAEAIIERCRS